MLEFIQIIKNLQYTLLLLIQQPQQDFFYQILKFTIHFATINTSPKISLSYVAPVFTIHFATINTLIVGITSYNKVSFTIHFATINTRQIRR